MLAYQNRRDLLTITVILQEDTMAEAGRKIMQASFIQMLDHEQGIRSGEKSEDIHQMRVATRRIRSLFELLEEYYKSKQITPYTAYLKKLASYLGSVRDLDVLIQNLENYMEKHQLAALAEVNEILFKRQAKARKKLVKFLDKPAHEDFLNAFTKFVNKTGKAAKQIEVNAATPYQVRHVLPVVIAEHLATIRAYETVIDNVDVHTFHTLRIEFKKLRYLVAGFKELLGTSAEEFIKDLKIMQDYLGELNDMTVAQRYFHDLLERKKLSAEAQEALNEYIQSCMENEQKQTENFRPLWDKFNTRTVQRRLSNALLVLR